MRFEKTATLTEIFAQSRLASLRERSSWLNRLNILLGLYLDARLRTQVRVTGYRQGTLTVACTNSTVAGQLRYLNRIYMQQLRQHGELCELIRINAVVSRPVTAESPKIKTHKPVKRLSPATAELLLHTSESLQGGEVSEALRRLARHVDGQE